MQQIDGGASSCRYLRRLKEEHYPSDITFLHDSFDTIICFKKGNGAKIPLSSYTFSTQFPLRDVLTAVLAENVSRI